MLEEHLGQMTLLDSMKEQILEYDSMDAKSFRQRRKRTEGLDTQCDGTDFQEESKPCSMLQLMNNSFAVLCS